MRLWTNTIHRWLYRMEYKGLKGTRDGNLGRPRTLSPEQEGAIEQDLNRDDP